METNKLVGFPHQAAYLILSPVIPMLWCMCLNLTQSLYQTWSFKPFLCDFWTCLWSSFYSQLILWMFLFHTLLKTGCLGEHTSLVTLLAEAYFRSYFLHLRVWSWKYCYLMLLYRPLFFLHPSISSAPLKFMPANSLPLIVARAFQPGHSPTFTDDFSIWLTIFLFTHMSLSLLLLTSKSIRVFLLMVASSLVSSPVIFSL